MKQYTKLDKLNYYSNRSRDKSIPESKRKYAHQKANELYDDIATSKYPTLRHKRGGRMGMVTSIKKILSDVQYRRTFFLSLPSRSERKTKEIEELRAFERDIENFMIKNKLNVNSEIYIVNGG